MKTKMLKKTKVANGFRDTFYFHRIKSLQLFGEFELPYIGKYNGLLPEKLINYLRNPSHPEYYFVHHYLYDYCFDGKNGIWYGCMEDSSRVESYLKKMGKYAGVISPDFSVYIDLPFAHQIWNIYRDRVTCAWLRTKGLNVILNIRWGDYRTYRYVFSGIEKHSVLAVGSHGLIKNPEDRIIFMNGFKEMIKRLQPKTLIIYGPYTNAMKEICEDAGTQVVHFDCEQIEARKGQK